MFDKVALEETTNGDGLQFVVRSKSRVACSLRSFLLNQNPNLKTVEMRGIDSRLLVTHPMLPCQLLFSS